MITWPLRHLGPRPHLERQTLSSILKSVSALYPTRCGLRPRSSIEADRRTPCKISVTRLSQLPGFHRRPPNLLLGSLGGSRRFIPEPSPSSLAGQTIFVRIPNNPAALPMPDTCSHRSPLVAALSPGILRWLPESARGVLPGSLSQCELGNSPAGPGCSRA